MQMNLGKINKYGDKYINKINLYKTLTDME